MTHAITIADGSTFAVGSDDDTLLQGALRAGLGFPHECSVGGCGACRFDLVDGDVDTLWDSAPGLSERDRKRGKRLACQSRPRGACTIKVRCSDDYRPPIAPRRRAARLVEKRPLTADMVEFTFNAEGPAAFLPGQYALLSLPDVAGNRAYSMSNAANENGEWRFIIRRVPDGKGTAVLFDALSVGDSITLDGPYGHAYLREEVPRDIVCIAGGSGLAPMLAVTNRALALPSPARRVHFFDGVRTAADLCAGPLFTADPGNRLSYLPVLSMADAAWSGESGFVHQAVARRLEAPFDRYEYYFAGPPGMVDAVQSLLMMEWRVPPGQIHFDRFC